MSDETGDTSVELDASKKTLKITGKKTAEIIAVLSLVVLGWMGFVLWQHSGEAKAGNDKLHDGINRMVRAQLEMTCLLGFPESERERKSAWCKQIASVGQ